MPIAHPQRPAAVVGQSRGPQRTLAGERRPAGVDGVIGVGRRRAPERHHRVADEFVDGAAVAGDLARHGVEIAREQRDDLIAKPFGQTGKAGDIREHHRQGSDRTARSRLDALADQRPHEIRRNIFAKRRKPAGHVGDGIRQIFEFDQARGMPSHLVEFEARDVFEFVDHHDQRRGDHAPREPGREMPAARIRTARPIEQLADRRFDRAEKFRFRDHGRQRPAGKGERG